MSGRRLLLLVMEFVARLREKAAAEGRFIPRTVAEYMELWKRVEIKKRGNAHDS